jgi:diacylglycerol kinase (ATP)
VFAGRRVLTVLNPTSGARRGADLAEELEADLRGHGASDAVVRVTEGPDDAPEWSASAAEEGFELVVAGGGDGTVTAVAQGVLRAGADLPVAVLPLGTGNGLARVLGVPLDPEEALEALAGGKPVRLDVLEVTSHDLVSLLFCGAGLDAKINEDADREAKDKLGFLAYVRAALGAARDLERHELELTVDGRTARFRGHTVIAFNATRLELLGIEVGPDSSPHDGLMDVAVMRTPTAWAALRRALRLLDRSRSRAIMRPAKSLRLEARPPLPVQVDGDPVGETPLEVRVAPSAVTFVAPADYPGG